MWKRLTSGHMEGDNMLCLSRGPFAVQVNYDPLHCQPYKIISLEQSIPQRVYAHIGMVTKTKGRNAPERKGTMWRRKAVFSETKHAIWPQISDSKGNMFYLIMTGKMYQVSSYHYSQFNCHIVIAVELAVYGNA